MKKEFEQYLGDIGFPPEFLPRLNAVLDFYTNVVKVPITYLLVNDYIKEDGQRIFDNVWLLNDTYMMEAKDFLISNDFDCAGYNSIEYWRVKSFDFDFHTPTDKSRIVIDMTLTCSGIGLKSSLKGTGKNCKYLFDFFTKEIPRRQENYCAQHRV